MSSTKLTLLIDEKLIQRAKRYSKVHNISLSQMVSRFLAALPGKRQEYPPKVRRLTGLLPQNASVDEYHEHLRRKHGQ
ncbi:MAG: DUF6364 family protein [Chromatiales bacterium]